MLPKIILDQKKVYEQAIAANEVASMLVAFVENRKHHLCIGGDQGGIKDWDDFIIQNEKDRFIHLQIKRQHTDFDKHRPCIKRSTDVKLSPFDDAFFSLAVWSKNLNATDTVNRRFVFELPGDKLQVKKELEVRQLIEFWTLHIKGTTTVEGLQTLIDEAKDTAAINIFNWLRTWCGFSDWGHILTTFKLLEFRTVGREPDLDNRSKTELDKIFSNSSDVLSKIKSYLLENSSYTGPIAPRQLLYELRDNLLPGCNLWTQIDGMNNDWIISGIHDLEDNNEMERPSMVIPQLWKTDRRGKLNINISPVSNTLAPIHEAVFQLALHLPEIMSGSCTNWQGWKVSLANKVWTLGDTNNDFERLPVVDNASPIQSFNGRPLNTSALRDDYTEKLNSEMIRVTWQMVSEKTTELIGAMDVSNSAELRNAAEERWTAWRDSIANNVSLQKEILNAILQPHSEGHEIIGRLRVGPKTKNLLAEAIYLSLIVSVALDNGNPPMMQAGDLRIGAIGLKYWSGPGSRKRKVRPIDSEDCIDELIGQQKCEIMILSQSRQPGLQIQQESLASVAGTEHSLAAGHKPRLLVTNNYNLQSIVDKGEIAQLRLYLQKGPDNSSATRTEAINRLT